ncbi:MAG TPA: HEAT repeat domain-containing protein [Chthonomonadaceae bacterium]|nr:HEAT repeat domain-containing protein [Chthonomonadaceae bacterium]
MGQAREDTFTVEAFQEALRRGDPAACRRLAQLAGEARQPGAAVATLCELVKPPRSLRQRFRMHREAWRGARIEAVRALGKIGDRTALPSLARALLDFDPLVREAAHAALRSYGTEIVPFLLALLGDKYDRSPEELNWSLEGMKALLALLGALKAREATPCLVRVLTGKLPYPPSRWGDGDVQRAFYYTMLLIVAGALLGFSTSPAELPALFFWTILASLIAFFTIFPLFYLFISLPIGSLQEARERRDLTLVAADALAGIQDKRALPGIVEAAFGSGRSVRGSAQWTLLHLLPLLGPEDFGALPPETLHRLTIALDHSSPRLTLAILLALEFVGTGQAVAPVRRLMNRSLAPEIRLEAARILPILEARQSQEQAASSLLRAAGMPPAAPEHLLRPAHGPSDAAPEQLLLPGHAPTNGA